MQHDSQLPPNPAPSSWPQLALQGAAAFFVLSLAWPYFVLRDEPLPWPAVAFAIGGVAFLLANVTHQAWWWRLIHVLFAPLAWLVTKLAIDPGWFLLAFVVMLLIYRGALTSRVPLYFSNNATTNALATLLNEYSDKQFLDLGAGIGSVLRPLSKTLPNAKLTGIENAPATWLVGYLRTARLVNCRWRWGNIWNINLGEYDVVYAFLSPAPMPDLWSKVLREMRPGTLFVSNSFAVPGVEASHMIEVDDARQTLLYCYRR